MSEHNQNTVYLLLRRTGTDGLTCPPRYGSETPPSFHKFFTNILYFEKKKDIFGSTCA